MEFVLGLLVGILIGFFWGVWRATQSFIERIINNPDDIKDLMIRIDRINQDAEQELATGSTSHEVRAEFYHDQCYLYDHNNQFLAQANSLTEALALAEQRHPDRKFEFRADTANKSTQNT
jgi:MFS superfamily sulfate permease-like transporter